MLPLTYFFPFFWSLDSIKLNVSFQQIENREVEKKYEKDVNFKCSKWELIFPLEYQIDIDELFINRKQIYSKTFQ